MAKKQIHEITCGSLDAAKYIYCFFIKLTEEGLTIRVPFRKFFISREYIEKLISEKQATKGTIGALRIIHRCPHVPSKIYFISTNWHAWFGAFEERAIAVEDMAQLRYADTALLKWVKRFFIFCRIWVFLWIVIALIAIIVMLILRIKS